MGDDVVGEALEQWAALHPEFDLHPMAVWVRIARLTQLWDRLTAAAVAEHGVQHGDVDVLATLYRYGGALRPRALRRLMLIGSGTLTPRIDRLERARLVERRPDEHDRRGRVVALTPAGRALVPAVIADLLEVEAGLLSGLPVRTRERLTRDLARLLEVLPDLDERGQRR